MKTLKSGMYVWISFIGKDNKTLLYNVEFDPDHKSQRKLDDKPAMADYMIKILDKLTFAGKCMPDGIPANIFTETVEAELKAARIKHDGAFNEILKALMAEGKIFEPKPGFFKVVV